MSSDRCRLCGATSYRHVIERDEGGRLTNGRLKQCSGCSEVFADMAAWRGDAEEQREVVVGSVTATPDQCAGPAAKRCASDRGSVFGGSRKRASPWGWWLASPDPAQALSKGDAVTHSKVGFAACQMGGSASERGWRAVSGRLASILSTIVSDRSRSGDRKIWMR